MIIIAKSFNSSCRWGSLLDKIGISLLNQRCNWSFSCRFNLLFNRLVSFSCHSLVCWWLLLLLIWVASTPSGCSFNRICSSLLFLGNLWLILRVTARLFWYLIFWWSSTTILGYCNLFVFIFLIFQLLEYFLGREGHFVCLDRLDCALFLMDEIMDWVIGDEERRWGVLMGIVQPAKTHLILAAEAV